MQHFITIFTYWYGTYSLYSYNQNKETKKKKRANLVYYRIFLVINKVYVEYQKFLFFFVGSIGQTSQNTFLVQTSLQKIVVLWAENSFKFCFSFFC